MATKKELLQRIEELERRVNVLEQNRYYWNPIPITIYPNRPWEPNLPIWTVTCGSSSKEKDDMGYRYAYSDPIIAGCRK